MSPELIAVLTLNAVLFGMMFKLMLHLDALRERTARPEGLFKGFAARQGQEPG